MLTSADNAPHAEAKSHKSGARDTTPEHLPAFMLVTRLPARPRQAHRGWKSGFVTFRLSAPLSGVRLPSTWMTLSHADGRLTTGDTRRSSPSSTPPRLTQHVTRATAEPPDETLTLSDAHFSTTDAVARVLPRAIVTCAPTRPACHNRRHVFGLVREFQPAVDVPPTGLGVAQVTIARGQKT